MQNAAFLLVNGGRRYSAYPAYSRIFYLVAVAATKKTLVKVLFLLLGYFYFVAKLTTPKLVKITNLLTDRSKGSCDYEVTP